jgi:hypothetical protein
VQGAGADNIVDFVTNGSEQGYVRGYGVQNSDDYVKDYYKKIKNRPSEGTVASEDEIRRLNAYNSGTGNAGTASGQVEDGVEIVEASGEVVPVKFTPSPFSFNWFGK